MKKYLLDMTVTSNEPLHHDYCLLKLTTEQTLPEMVPGQFVEVRVDDSPSTFLRRPISVNYVDRIQNELWLLIRLIGEGTRRMARYRAGETVNVLLPLGNGFSIPQKPSSPELLLVGGGVGTAPMLYLGESLKKAGFTPVFLLGARSGSDILQREDFEKYGSVYITTED